MTYTTTTIIRAQTILGYGLSDISGEREYTPVDGVLYTDVFESEPTLTGYSGSFKLAFNGKVGGSRYYNEIWLNDSCVNSVTVDAVWGSCDLMEDIGQLLAWIQDDTPQDALDDSGISSKKIEDFSVSFKSAEQSQSDMNHQIEKYFGYFIRKPIILDVASEQKHDYRYF